MSIFIIFLITFYLKNPWSRALIKPTKNMLPERKSICHQNANIFWKTLKSINFIFRVYFQSIRYYNYGSLPEISTSSSWSVCKYIPAEIWDNLFAHIRSIILIFSDWTTESIWKFENTVIRPGQYNVHFRNCVLFGSSDGCLESETWFPQSLRQDHWPSIFGRKLLLTIWRAAEKINELHWSFDCYSIYWHNCVSHFKCSYFECNFRLTINIHLPVVVSLECEYSTKVRLHHFHTDLFSYYDLFCGKLCDIVRHILYSGNSIMWRCITQTNKNVGNKWRRIKK